MFCKYCGARMDDDSEFCPLCGKAQEGEPDDETPVRMDRVRKSSEMSDEEEEKSGLKKVFLIIGAIASFLAVVLGFGLLFASGVQVSGAGDLLGGLASEGQFYKVTDYFNFSETGIINAMKQIASSQNLLGELLGLIFSFILVYVLLLTLFVLFIIGITAFVKAMKGEDYEKIGKVASRVFETFTVGMLVFLILHVTTEGSIAVTLNGGALAGIIIIALLIAVNFVMHLLTRGFGLLNLKRILSIVFTALILCCGAIIAGLASGATYKVDGKAYGMFTLFTSSVTDMKAIAGGAKVYAEGLAYSLFGFISAIILVSFGVKLIRTAMNNVQAIGDNAPAKIKGLGVSVTALVFSAVFIAVHYLYAGAFKETKALDPALPIVIAVFAVISIVSSVLTKKFAQSLKEN